MTHFLNTVYPSMNGAVVSANLGFRLYPVWPWGGVVTTEEQR